MKLVNPRLGLEVELSENQVLNITVESPVKFSEVVYHICRQAGGEEGEQIKEAHADSRSMYSRDGAAHLCGLLLSAILPGVDLCCRGFWTHCDHSGVRSFLVSVSLFCKGGKGKEAGSGTEKRTGAGNTELGSGKCPFPPGGWKYGLCTLDGKLRKQTVRYRSEK